jgi:hypothetical protein
MADLHPNILTYLAAIAAFNGLSAMKRGACRLIAE